MKKNLVIATSRKTMGGITSVIKAHEGTMVWDKYNTYWLQTHIDGVFLLKLYFFIKSFIIFIFIAPFYDIIHIHVSEPVSIKRKQFFYYVAKFYRLKIIIHFHSFSIETTLKGDSCAIYQRLFKGSDKILVLSKQWQTWVETILNIPHRQVDVLYNPCPIIASVQKNKKKEKLILFAGALNERKGYLDLLKAFSQISDKYPEWQIVFAGNGDLEMARQQASRLGVHDKVKFVGWINGSAKEELFSKSSIFCLPSYAEGFPMAVLDAWAYGLPVITTPVGGLPDVLVDKFNALVFEPGDINSLSENLDLMISDVPLREKIEKESIALSKGKFNIENLSKELANIYKTL